MRCTPPISVGVLAGERRKEHLTHTDLFEGAFYAKRDSVHGISEVRPSLPVSTDDAAHHPRPVGQPSRHQHVRHWLLRECSNAGRASLVLRKPKLPAPRSFLLTF